MDYAAAAGPGAIRVLKAAAELELTSVITRYPASLLAINIKLDSQVNLKKTDERETKYFYAKLLAKFERTAFCACVNNFIWI